MYGFRLDSFVAENGTADLVLDLDFVLKWPSPEQGCMYTVCQAVLRFHEVFNLKFSLDYATPTAGICPIYIAEIHRDALTWPNGFRSYRWHIEYTWPHGDIFFESPGFTQSLLGNPLVQDVQVIPADKRTWHT
jgi:hypothetical protein